MLLVDFNELTLRGLGLREVRNRENPLAEADCMAFWSPLFIAASFFCIFFSLRFLALLLNKLTTANSIRAANTKSRQTAIHRSIAFTYDT